MRRRDFIAFGGIAVAWPICSRALQAKTPTRIGLLPFGSPSNAYDQVASRRVSIRFAPSGAD